MKKIILALVLFVSLGATAKADMWTGEMADTINAADTAARRADTVISKVFKIGEHHRLRFALRVENRTDTNFANDSMWVKWQYSHDTKTWSAVKDTLLKFAVPNYPLDTTFNSAITYNRDTVDIGMYGRALIIKAHTLGSGAGIPLLNNVYRRIVTVFVGTNP